MKKWDENTIGTVYPILESIIYNIMINRVIVPRIKDKDDIFDPYEMELWTHISNNAIQMAALDWCKVFGSVKNEIYYTKYINKERFLQRIETIDFAKVRDEMVWFRNKYVAHCGLYDSQVPFFDGAMMIVSAFKDEVEAEYDLHGLSLYPIDGLCEAYQIRIEDYLEKHNIDFEP